MGEVLDDSKSVTIVVEQVVEPGQLELIAYSVTPVTANPGDRFSATTTVKNVGVGMAGCLCKLVIQDTGEIIDIEPGTEYKNLEPGESWTVRLTSIYWTVPDMEGPWNLVIEAWRQV